MNINWVLANQVVLDPLVDSAQMKTAGSIWGGWQTWRSCQTDNVICHDLQKAQELIQRQFHYQCNFFIPKNFYVTLGRPDNVKLYEGDFSHELDHREDVVAMHLASSLSDVVLLLGFDLQALPDSLDRLQKHRKTNYQNLFRTAIKNNPEVQWVLIDHVGEIAPEIASLPNLSSDTFHNTLKLLSS